MLADLLTHSLTYLLILHLQEIDKIVQDLTATMKADVNAKSYPEVKAQAAQTIKKPFPYTQTHISLGQLTIGKESKDFAALLLANHILGGNSMSSRLFETIREKNGLAYDIHSLIDSNKEFGVFEVNMQTQNENAEKALTLLNQELERFWKDGPNQEEFQAAKDNLLGSIPLWFVSNSSILNASSRITYQGLSEQFYDKLIKDLEAVTPEHVKAAFQKHIGLKDFQVVMVGAVE